MSESSRSESNYNRESNHRSGGFNKRNDRNSSYSRDRGGNKFGEKSFGGRNRNEGEDSRASRNSGGYRDRNEGRNFNRSNRNESSGSFNRDRDRGGYRNERDSRGGGFGGDRRENRGGFGGHRPEGRSDELPSFDRRGDRGGFRRDNDRNEGGKFRDGRRDNREDRGGYRNERGQSDRFRSNDRDNRGHQNRDRDGYRSDSRNERRGSENKRFNNNESRFSDGHQRGGQQRRDARDSAAPNAGYRPSKGQGPEIDTDVTGRELDGSVLRQLRALEKDNADVVGQHLVMAGRYLDIDPKFALEHAQAATRRAGRIAAVREAAGIAAYVAEDFELALRELRTHRRISGSDEHLAVLIDTERALGHIEKALELAEESKQLELKPAERVETAIVVSGIKHDQGDLAGAIEALEIPELNSQRGFDYSPRLFEAYGALLEEDGREKEATRWYRLAIVTEAALGQGEFEEPEIFDIFGEPELFEDEEEPSVSLTDIEIKTDESEIDEKEDDDFIDEDEQDEDTLSSAETTVSEEQASEENLQSFDEASETETERKENHED